MRALPKSLIAVPIVALALLGAGNSLSPREMMEFGLEAARHGLWREAVFRWERTLKQDPQNARLRNNLAVAYESTGDLDGAAREYEEALRLDPKNQEIRDNYESFQELQRERSGGSGEAGQAARGRG